MCFIFISATPSGTIPVANGMTICPAFYATIGVELSYFTTLDGWFKDDVQIDFATAGLKMRHDSVLEFLSPQKSDAGVYHFSASNKKGTTTSNKIVVHFISKRFTLYIVGSVIKVTKACFIRRASHVPNALKTIGNQPKRLILYCF